MPATVATPPHAGSPWAWGLDVSLCQSVLIESKFMYAARPPAELDTLSKHQSNIKTLMCKGSKDRNHHEHP